MARRERRGAAGRGMGVTASLKGLVEAIAERVVERASRQLPGREQLRHVERELRRLARRVESGSGRPGARRVGRPRSNRKCKVNGCGLPHVAQGFCSKHYQAWRRRKLQGSTRALRKGARRRISHRTAAA